MEPIHFLISGVIVGGAFVAGLFWADRAYNRDRKEWQTERVEKTRMIARQVDAIRELHLDKNELMDDNRAIQAQNERLARQRFALMNSEQAEAA